MKKNKKVAFINGGARMGEGIALALAGRGMDIVLSYRSSKKTTEKICHQIIQMGCSAYSVRCDVSREQDVKKTIQFISRQMGRLDVLVNMASTYDRTTWENLTSKDWDRQINNNAKGVYLMVKEASSMLKASQGRVINFCDWTAVSGRPHYKNFVPYYSAKSAVLGLTQAQALELAPAVLVNAIAPGPILPPKQSSAKEIKAVILNTPLKKWGGVEEIAKTVLFLCETNFVTGECIRVDGGRHLF